jgi:glutathione-regulated potassium-efflux system ancillary protein KefG
VAPDVSTEELVGAAEVAEILGLSHAASVSTYLHRYPDFPAPIVNLKKSRVRLWLRPQVQAWNDGRRRQRGRPPKN